MDLRSLVRDFIGMGKDLTTRLRSGERKSLNDVDLHLLRVQLHLLEIQSANAQIANLYEKSKSKIADVKKPE
jgi:hypothetical protein